MIKVVKHIVILVSVAYAIPAESKILDATTSTLSNIWKTAAGGDTIRLTGTFAGTTILQNKLATKAIKLDATNAMFTGTLKFQSVSNIKVVGGKFDLTGAASAYGKAIVVYRSSNVSFDKATVVANAKDSQTGISFEGVTNSSITNSTFTNLGAGVGVTASSYIKVTGNRVVGATKDGYDIYNDHHVLVANNSCAGSHPQPGAHPDCVQLASTKGLPVESDIKVIDNIATGMTQGFTSFLGSATGSLRITIADNIVNSLMSQGVACYGCVDSFITGNFLSAQPGAAHFVNLNVIGGSNTVVANNRLGSLSAPISLPTDYAAAYRLLTGKTYRSNADAMNAMDFTSAGATVSMASFAAAIPEPGEWALFVTGFGLVGFTARRRPLSVVAA